MNRMIRNKHKKELTKEEQMTIVSKEELSNADYELVYTVYYERVFNFINSRVSKRVDAEDLTSHVFERVLKKLPDFQWQGVSIVSWIYRIARNAVIDFYRKNNDRKTDSSIELIGDFLESDEEKIDNIIIESDEQADLFNALREFEDEDQYLIYYKFFEELSNKEIAELTGLSETNVGTKLHRLRAKLKGLIESKDR